MLPCIRCTSQTEPKKFETKCVLYMTKYSTVFFNLEAKFFQLSLNLFPLMQAFKRVNEMQIAKYVVSFLVLYNRCLLFAHYNAISPQKSLMGAYLFFGFLHRGLI